MPLRRRPGFSLVELLVVLAIVATLIGLLLPAVQKVRHAAARARCANNLRQVGLALHQYHDAHGGLPPGCSYRAGADPHPHMTWLTRLLPYIEQESLWRQSLRAFEQEPFFEKGPHLPVLGTLMSLYACPADDRAAAVSMRGLNGQIQVAFTSYLGVGGLDRVRKDGVLFLDSLVRLADITDGTSTTLAAGERPPSADLIYGWWYAGWGQDKDGSADSVLGVRERNTVGLGCPAGPYRFAPAKPSDPCAMFQFWSTHPGGAHFLFADASARFLRYDADSVMPALATRSGREVVSDMP